MLCPRCQVPVSQGQCPSCGVVWDPEASPSESAPEGSKPSAGVVGLEMLEPRSKEETSPPPDWRSELRRRLDQHTAKGSRDKSAQVPGEAQEGSSLLKSPLPRMGGGVGSKLFDYKLKNPEGKKPLDNPVRPREAPKARAEVFERPLSRVPTAQTGPKAEPDPKKSTSRQPMLKLQPIAIEDPGPAPEHRAKVAAPPGQLRDQSREVLLSRFLAGIIDVTFPTLMGIGFGFFAVWMAGLDFFTREGLFWVAGFAIGLFLFTSVFFLSSLGQTPGMQFTQLVLRSSAGKGEIPMSSILLRVLVFLPSVLSVVGVVWSILDPLHRCIHDILSGTYIAPSER